MISIYSGKVVQVLGSRIFVNLDWKDEEGEPYKEVIDVKKKGRHITFSLFVLDANTPIDFPKSDLSNLKELVGKTVKLFRNNGIFPTFLNICVLGEE